MKDMQLAKCSGSWGGESEIILEWLSMKGVFTHMSEPDKPYFNRPEGWGVCLDYLALQKLLKENPFSISKARMKRCCEIWKKSEISPTIRILGMTAERMMEISLDN